MNTVKPTVTVGVEIIAILFQGGIVNLNDVTLIPDSTISNAARFGMNVAHPPMQEAKQESGSTENTTA